MPPMWKSLLSRGSFVGRSSGLYAVWSPSRARWREHCVSSRFEAARGALAFLGLASAGNVRGGGGLASVGWLSRHKQRQDLVDL